MLRVLAAAAEDPSLLRTDSKHLPGALLYNGERPFDVRGVRVLNPLHVEDIWRTLTESPEKGKH